MTSKIPMTLEEKKAKLRAALRSYSKQELIEKFNSYEACGPSIVSISIDPSETFVLLHAEVEKRINDCEEIYLSFNDEYSEAA
ncbi:hypothetical protein LF935_16205 [Pectobacterium carotovorum]|uniref:hypothetical protein n=1 Tax=Pectobacterium carotovorum TaxID=554 RepID=UPI001CF2B174|nr:hypothetical protein [Pectobacterium carotovorum]MCA6971185.1 hypothetical protein [Pectobacterium carotovorum]